VTKLLGVVVLLLGLLFAADRIAAHEAESELASVVQHAARLPRRPTVSVGFPFLTQVLRGRYTDITVRATDLFADAAGKPIPDTSSLQLDFAGVHVPLSRLLQRDFRHVPVDRIAGTAVIPFDRISAAAHVRNLAIAPGPAPDELEFRLSVAAIEVGVVARLSIDGTVLAVTPVQITGTEDAAVSAVIEAQLRRELTYRVQIPGMPAGVSLTNVTVNPAGVSLDAAGRNVTLDAVVPANARAAEQGSAMARRCRAVSCVP